MATSSEDQSYPRPFSVQNLDPVLPNDLVWEFLIWLPVKSLMRFKCVSKLWQSIILNPSFARAYRGGFRGVLIDEPNFWRYSSTKDFFYLNLFDDDETVDDDNGLNSLMDDQTVDDDNDLNSLTDDETFDDDGLVCKSTVKYLSYNHTVHTVDYRSGRELGSTDIADGLVCFYTGNYSCLYNIATRETMELPLSQSQYDNRTCSYHLGFDPVNKLYKLLKICPIYDEEDKYFNEQLTDATLICNLDSEILTLGIDKSWRNIEAAPLEIVGRSVCFDGVLYWQQRETDDYLVRPEGVIAFHLAQEKFEFISIPNHMYYLPRFAPGLTLMAVNYKEVDIIRCGKGGRWADKQKIKRLEEHDSDSDDFEVQGILPDGKVLILNDDSFVAMHCPSSCYLYDPAEKKFTRVVIRKSPSSPSIKFERYIKGYMSYFEENIIPLSVFTTATTSSRP